MLDLRFSQELQLTLIHSIGKLKELSPLSKIKVNVVLVGLSQLPDLQKELNSLKIKNYYHSLNNNQLIVLDLMVIKDVTEDLWMMLSNMQKKTELFLNLIMLIREPPINVTHLPLVKLLSKLALLLMFLKTALIKWQLPYNMVLYQQLLMLDLYGSNSIEVEFINIIVDFHQITVFQLSDMELIMVPHFTKLKTHGDLDGE